MKNNNLFLPGFHLSTLRKKPRSKAQKLADHLDKLKQHSISQLGEYFDQFIPKQYLENNQKGKFSRLRLFSKSNTFWAFFSQVLDADAGCKEAVRKTQAYMVSKLKNMPSNSSSAYCQARKKLDIDSLNCILEHTSDLHNKSQLWKGHRVVVVDGTGLSMPDTQTNQTDFPQQKNQKIGCGFPIARALACFCLHTGALLSYRLGNKKSHELRLLREQHQTFKAGDIFLGDKMFCSYFDINEFNNKCVDSVITHAKRTPKTKSEALSIISKNDLLIEWKKPVRTIRSSYSKEQWDDLPETLTLRQIKVTVKNTGFRVQSFYIVTTLLDSDIYTESDIADLYYQRWDVELFFRDIKATMGMDILRCKTPTMVRKEIVMHLIVYNCIRLLMVQAANQAKVTPRLISFKETMQALRQWQSIIGFAYNDQRQITRIRQAMIDTIANSILYQRLGRNEPRCVKRRPKPCQLMTVPRSQMKELPHRGKKSVKKA